MKPNPSIEEIGRLGKRLRYDLTAAQGKLTDLLNAIEAIDRERSLPCPECGVGGGFHAVDCSLAGLVGP